LSFVKFGACSANEHFSIYDKRVILICCAALDFLCLLHLLIAFGFQAFVFDWMFLKDSADWIKNQKAINRS